MKEPLSRRQIAIIEFLLHQEKACPSSVIAKEVDCSEKTVRAEITFLKQYLGDIAKIEVQKAKGFSLSVNDTEHLNSILYLYHRYHDYRTDRIKHITRVLLERNDFITIQELSDQLFVSKSTLQKSLNEVKELLTSYNLNIISKSWHGILVEGSEMNKRFCLSSVLITDHDESQSYLKYRKLLTPAQYDALKTIIINAFQEENTQLSDVTLNALVAHLTIMIKRIESNNLISEKISNLKPNAIQRKIATKLLMKIEEAYQIKFPEREIDYLVVHLLGIHFKEPDSAEFFESDFVELMTMISDSVALHYGLDIFSRQEFIRLFVMHLKPAINRIRYNMNIRNILLDDIKLNYPLAYEVAIHISDIISNQVEIDIPEDEIGFLALYIGAEMENKKHTHHDKKRIIIVNPNSESLSQLIKNKIISKFGDRVCVIAYTDIQGLSKYREDEVDLIVSTIDLGSYFLTPVVKIKSPFANDYLDAIAKKMRIGYHLEEHINKDTIYLNKDFTAWKEVIDFLCSKIAQYYHINDDFKQSVLERESKGSTCYGNLVAIPHAMKSFYPKTILSFVSLQNPIVWKNRTVQLFCLLNIGTDNENDIESVFNFLTELINDQDRVKALLQSKSVDEFKDWLIYGDSR